MADVITEVTNVSWFGRLKNAVVGVLVGGVLLLVGMGVLFWNEGRAVKTAAGLAEGEKACISVPADSLDPANNGKLIHFTANATTDARLADPQFAIKPDEPVLRLKRDVEMYQWKEHRKSKKKSTTYTYSKEWADHVINSGSFHDKSGHQNPSRMPWPSEIFDASPIKAGPFTLSHALVEQINNYENIVVPPNTGVEADPAVAGLKVSGNGYYKGNDPSSPQVGDVRIEFSVCRPGPVSVIAVQAAGGALGQFTARAGATILDLRTETLTAAQQFEKLRSEAALMTWLIRLGGFLAISIGFALFLRPLAVLAEVIPFIGTLVEGGTILVAGIVGAALSVIVIGVAWLYYRPLLSLGLFAGAAVAVYSIRHLRGGKRKPSAPRQVPPIPPPPPPIPVR